MLGALCAGLSAVAADNPHAWFRQARSADEIATVSPSNRMIGFPYPKLMNAIIEVDQAAAVLMTSVGEARALGIPRRPLGVPLGQRPGARPVVRLRSRRLRRARRPSARPGRQALDGRRHRHRAGGSPRHLQLLPGGRADRARRRSASRPTIRGRSRSPVACRTSVGRATTTACTASPRSWTGCARGPGRSASSRRWGGTSPSTRSACTAPQPKDGPFVREDPAPRQAVLDAQPGARAGPRAVGRRVDRDLHRAARPRRRAGARPRDRPARRRPPFPLRHAGRPRRARRARRRSRASAGAAASRTMDGVGCFEPT